MLREDFRKGTDSIERRVLAQVRIEHSKALSLKHDIESDVESDIESLGIGSIVPIEVVPIEGMTHKFAAQIGNYRCYREAVRVLLAEVGAARSREMLARRYIRFQKYSEIANGMNISLRSVYRLHAKALGEFKNVLEAAFATYTEETAMKETAI